MTIVERHDDVSGGAPEGDRAASTLSLVALTVAAVAVPLGATLLWSFVALPLALVAAGCALLDVRRSRRSGGRRSGATVVALALAVIAVVVSAGSLAAVPLVKDQLDDANGGVRADLRSVERSFRGAVDDLDRTLTRNVDVSTASLRRDFDRLERTTGSALAQTSDRVDRMLTQLEADYRADLRSEMESVRTDLRELERSLREDDRAYVDELRRLQEFVRSELARLESGVDAVGGQPR